MLYPSGQYDAAEGLDGISLPPDYLMINSLSIKHFRGFEDVTVPNLQRVNVVVGENGSGKTALLEAVFLAGAGSPEIGIRLQNFRGMGTANEISGDGLRALWRDLFYGFNQDIPVEISLIDKSKQPRTVTVSLIEDEEVSLPLEEYEAGTGVIRNVPIEFQWTDASGIHKSRPSVSDNGRVTFPSAKHIQRAAFFPSQFRLNPEEVAKRLSKLSKREQLDGMIELIRKVYGNVEGISVENNAGSWQVFAKLEGFVERVPIALHSAGVTKFVSIVFGIAEMEGGCVLIDEVENGFYYNRQEQIWDALYQLASEFRCQLFVTTHSKECLKSLLPVLEDHGRHFALLKTYAAKGREPAKIAVSSGTAMTAAIEQDFDIR